jgi:peptide/nickel transport system ATP-binding protein
VFAALPAAKQEKCLTLEPPLEAVQPSAAVKALEAGPVPVLDQQFACFFPDGELDEGMLVVHETAEPHTP